MVCRKKVHLIFAKILKLNLINCTKFEFFFMSSPVLFYPSADKLFYNYPNLDQIIILCDENTRALCLPKLGLPQSVPVIEVNAGEESKSIENLAFIWDSLLHFKANRTSILVNLGGGVISDLGGMAASTYNRGIPCINIPTTLMGMVDAAHGGKTGINQQQYKNYLGTFSLPKEVWICPDFLKTLAPKEIASGFAEMLKHSLIADPSYFDELCQIDIQNLLNNTNRVETYIKKSVEIKNKFVNQDQHDKGIRQLLNFGHTIGHGLESFFMDKHVSHGECVAAGIICEAYVSMVKELLGKNEFEKIKHSIDTYYKRLIYSKNDISSLVSIITKDKKNDKKGIKCVLLKGIGQAEFGHLVSTPEIVNALEYYLLNE